MGLGMLAGLVYSALVLGVTMLGLIEQLLRVCRRRRAPAVQKQRTMASAGLDVMSVLFSPSYRHKLEYVEAQESRRDQPGDGAPPRSHVDLGVGIAHLVIPARTAERLTGTPPVTSP
jgi:Family of unknown function (DUF6191)